MRMVQRSPLQKGEELAKLNCNEEYQREEIEERYERLNQKPKIWEQEL